MARIVQITPIQSGMTGQESEPSPGDLCVSLRVNRGWHGEHCETSGFLYICEKGN